MQKLCARKTVTHACFAATYRGERDLPFGKRLAAAAAPAAGEERPAELGEAAIAAGCAATALIAASFILVTCHVLFMLNISTKPKQSQYFAQDDEKGSDRTHGGCLVLLFEAPNASGSGQDQIAGHKARQQSTQKGDACTQKQRGFPTPSAVLCACISVDQRASHPAEDLCAGMDAKGTTRITTKWCKAQTLRIAGTYTHA
jgi:hypothetical protein